MRLFALAALAATLVCAPAQAATYFFSGAPLFHGATTHDPIEAVVVLPDDLMQFLAGDLPNEIIVNHAAAARVSDGVSSTANPDIFQLRAFLSSTGSIDWSQGWELSAVWGCSASGCEYEAGSQYSGSAGLWASVEQVTDHWSSAPVLGQSRDGLVGSWSTTPEASTWLMMLLGFAGLGYTASRRRGLV